MAVDRISFFKNTGKNAGKKWLRHLALATKTYNTPD